MGYTDFNKESFLNMVNSDRDMLFAYDKAEDRLYLSPETQKALGTRPVVRGYWKDSENWNWIPQQDQEALVNILRQDGQEDKVFVYQVALRCEKGKEPVSYRLEMTVLRSGEDGDIIGVRGVMRRVQ